MDLGTWARERSCSWPRILPMQVLLLVKGQLSHGQCHHQPITGIALFMALTTRSQCQNRWFMTQFGRPVSHLRTTNIKWLPMTCQLVSVLDQRVTSGQTGSTETDLVSHFKRLRTAGMKLGQRVRTIGLMTGLKDGLLGMVPTIRTIVNPLTTNQEPLMLTLFSLIWQTVKAGSSFLIAVPQVLTHLNLLPKTSLMLAGLLASHQQRKQPLPKKIITKIGLNFPTALMLEPTKLYLSRLI